MDMNTYMQTLNIYISKDAIIKFYKYQGKPILKKNPIPVFLIQSTII